MLGGVGEDDSQLLKTCLNDNWQYKFIKPYSSLSFNESKKCKRFICKYITYKYVYLKKLIQETDKSAYVFKCD